MFELLQPQKRDINQLYIVTQHAITDIYRANSYVAQLEGILQKIDTLLAIHESLSHSVRRMTDKETKEYAAALKKPLHLQVFVTPTWPYCPQAVRLAHQLAMESSMVNGDMVEAIEFPHLSMKYQVQGVPRTVINENTFMEGAAPEQMLIQKVKQALAG